MQSIQNFAPIEALTANWARLNGDIAACARAAGRDPDDITLLAVSKTRTVEEIAAMWYAGARHFGENYLQDALPKLDTFSARKSNSEAHCDDIHWHFIGALQSNKTRTIAERFDWVHTVDRAKIARRLSDARPDGRAPLNLCLQVNLHNEAQKGGVSAAELPALLDEIASLPRLALRGLMILPAIDVDPEQAFARLAALFAASKTQLPTALQAQWDTLSMGMSGDYGAAIRAGSTMVRIGTALFGPRTTKPVTSI